MSLRYTFKSLMLCAAISAAVIAPMPAMAENIYIMAVNTRSEDGVYRPALRVVRGGTVTYYRSDDANAANPITANIIQNKALLKEWLTQNAGMTAEEAGSVIVEEAPSTSPSTCIDRSSSKGALGSNMGQLVLAADPGDCCHYPASTTNMPNTMNDLVPVQVIKCRRVVIYPADII